MGFLTGFESIVRRDEPLAMHTRFQLGGPAEYFAEPETPEQLIELIARCAQEEIPTRLLGDGSNIMIRDEGVPGMVFHLAAEPFRKIRVDGNRITVGGGAPLTRAITTAVHQGLAGLEMLIGIPGTLGGALHGNAGAHGGDIGQWAQSASVITDSGEAIARTRDDLVFAYRESSLDELVILEATFTLREEDPKELAKKMQKNWIVRKASQPLGHQSAGCVFKNPRGESAGKLIERSGLKGTRIGGAQVSERHACFIIAEPECTSQDVLRLIDLIQTQVLKRTEIEIEMELEVW